jgi:hypothetical protein
MSTLSAARITDLTGKTILNNTGSILQVVQSTLTTQITTTSTSYVSTGLSATITPSSATNKILILLQASIQLSGANNGIGLAIYRNGSTVYSDPNAFASSYVQISGNSRAKPTICYLDSPSSTSTLTYLIYFQTNAGTIYFSTENALSSLTLFEVSA